ncbi:MAG: phosphate ABC transporter permease subunit PstC [Candidatus Omnitrophica bacterium CG12_big_fil_rev_8_21_14_0_65_43_15]|uniref:Phosphate transport system permease protein n=1 Tax=Candidatus Taenaricola geysiri TaxID=1974752 RepID=A0A2J0LJ83_9BACT|nr:MAG: phosphate ABC transporter permease subunit PstC [Candidatus Omnitrophica bacterium CG12_big_fil_rev_8_21_14_0_65_43_15]PIW80725.1 MAG: phosphate ABC transporter permease subunit PstC [Candidatus Omnitrophica bacterium CG_4_8_14_3_um_filter_43_15]PIY83959.1 MAG: phosphate ABC transporter permease subunit PstC [Candidatus Omnitrophica bacterium CG_4_10_14_0_8_um_filter_43_18]PJC46791.1 MAG: phosphate ABC transporter permease subunit PstC [Candidatus Omnitrophica bacterium CG_4_9_14_0_2_um_
MIKVKERLYKWLFTILAFASLIFLVGIVIVLFKEALPIFKKVKALEFIFGKFWYPTYDPPEFGIFPLILASVWVSVGAMLVCVPLGVGSALYLNEIASHKQKAVLKPLVEILASIPSIVYGFFGMVVLAPFLQNLLHLPIGLCAFTASLTLGIMATPTVCSIAEDALSYVPKSFREASFAVGANRWQTLVKVVIPAAGSGISTAIILGMSRAIGETMTVLMVAGGAAVIPKSFFDPVRPMTSAIAAEMGEAPMGSDHFHALFAIALILFLITFVFNVIAEAISRKYRIKLGLSG